MNKLTVSRIENSSIYFTYSTVADIFVQILVNEKVIYSADLSVQPGGEYYIGHPHLLIVEKADLDVRENEYQERHHLQALVSQSTHIINLVGIDTYNKISKYVNSSYWEIFVDNTAGFDPERLKRCKVVVELGSNVGYFTKYVTRLSKIEKYICVEPCQELNEVNLALNGTDSNIFIYKAAFSDTDGEEVDFWKTDDETESPHDTMFPEINEYFATNSDKVHSIKVPTISLPTIIEQNGLKSIDYLKVDIEGAERFLLSPINYKALKEYVKRMMVEVHTEDLRIVFSDVFNMDGFRIEKVKGIHYHIVNTAFSDDIKTEKIGNVLVKVACPALGDTLCSTPTIRKIAQSYGHPVSVQTNRPDLFKNNPHVDAIYDFSLPLDSAFKEVFETYNQWIKTNRHMSGKEFNDTPIEMKLHMVEARQLHAFGVGMYLYPNELSCDFFPDEQTEISQQIDKNWVVLHTTESWECRTWPNKYWDRLVHLIKTNTDLKIVTIGRSHKESDYFEDLQKNVVRIQEVDLDLCVDGAKYQNEGDPGAISEMWHVINNARALISFDSGPIHLAGTTDTDIIQIGSSINPLKTAPWRNGSQDYKFHFVGSECKLFCASDPKYSVKEWGTINSIPYVPLCQEHYPEFFCQPTPDQVFMKLLEIL